MAHGDQRATPPPADAAGPPPADPPAKLKVAGAWSGALEVRLEAWTLSMLREEVARRSGGDGVTPDRISLICGGRVLKEADGPKSLAELGIKNNAKMLATVLSGDRGKAFNDQAKTEAERSKKLARIKDAAKALAERHADGSLPMEDFNIELEDQNGLIFKFGSESDKKALMMGLMMHTNARSLIRKQNYNDALEVLYMGEEAFSLCDSQITEMIDNLPMLQVDIVWCYFMLRDISCLTVAGMRLEKARKGFNRSHGKDSTRMRLLRAGRQTEIAIYARLELLEGVLAYHTGNLKEAYKALSSAQAKCMQLQVLDETLSLLMSMGYKEKEAKRALKMTGLDVQSAVEFLIDERAKKLQKTQENIQREAEILEQKKYGATPKKKAVDLQKLNELESIGFERNLAAEALRLNENDSNKALDILTDPERNCELQSRLEARSNMASARKSRNQQLLSMGYYRSSAENAARRSNTLEEALRLLAGSSSGFNQNEVSHQVTRHEEGQPSAPGNHPVEEQVKEQQHPYHREEEMEDDPADEQVQEQHHIYQRDEEMEGELARELTGDPIADYDIDVIKEGESIAEYMALLDSAGVGAKLP